MLADFEAGDRRLFQANHVGKLGLRKFVVGAVFDDPDGNFTREGRLVPRLPKRIVLAALQPWLHYYNYERKHRGIDRLTPMAKLAQLQAVETEQCG